MPTRPTATESRAKAVMHRTQQHGAIGRAKTSQQVWRKGKVRQELPLWHSASNDTNANPDHTTYTCLHTRHNCETNPTIQRKRIRIWKRWQAKALAAKPTPWPSHTQHFAQGHGGKRIQHTPNCANTLARQKLSPIPTGTRRHCLRRHSHWLIQGGGQAMAVWM